MDKKRKNRRRWLKAVLVVLLLPVLLFGFVQTPPGKFLLAKAFSAALSRSEGSRIQIEDIRGWIPWEVSIGTMTLGDAEGEWMTGKDLHCRWMMRRLLQGEVVFQELGAREIVWHRFPETDAKEARASKAFSGLPEMELFVEGLQVDRFVLAKGLAGTELSYAVHSGSVQMRGDGHLTGTLAVSGDAEGAVMLDAVLRGKPEDYLGIEVDLIEMQHPTFGLDHLSGHAAARINAEGVYANLESRLMLDGQEGRLETGMIFADRTLSFNDFRLYGPKNSCKGDVAMHFEPGAIQIELSPSEINILSNQFVLAGQGAVATSNQTWGVQVDALNVTGWNAVDLTFSGHVNEQDIDLQGMLTEMDVATLPITGASNFTGKVNGQLAVTGSLEQPNAVVGIQVSGFKSVLFSMEHLAEIDFSIAGGIQDGMMFGETSITNYGQGFLNADASMPCTFSFTPMRCKPEVRDLRAELEALVILENLNELPWMQNQRLGGVVDTHIKYADEQAEGYVYLTDGAYEHYDFGVVFRDFNAMADISDTGIQIAKATATDGGDGRVKLSGGLTHEGLDLRLDLSNAWVIRRDEMDAEVDGTLDITGPVHRPEVDGTLTIKRADIQLDNIAPPPPELLVDYERKVQEKSEELGRIDQSPSPVGLDVKILMPDQVFVNASMIDAVLGGALHIQDVPKGISVKGTIEPRRGYISFVGKKFRFTDGEITMDGSVPSVTMIDNLTAEYSRKDFTARLIINGRAEDPDIRLESTPSMPEDEILSHVLFNRDTGSISAYQAYQIAMAARQLANGLSGPGFMYQIRKAVGVDTLEWREGEEAGASSSVAAGKYITTGLYIEVNQTLEEEGQTGMSAEYEVSRHFSLETYTGPKLRPGIGVNWRKDY